MRVILRDIANYKAEKSCKEDKIKFKVKKVSTRVVRVGSNETMCQYCKNKCHYNCAFGDGEEKKNCVAMNKEKNYFCNECDHVWNQHINYREQKQEVFEEEELVTNE